MEINEILFKGKGIINGQEIEGVKGLQGDIYDQDTNTIVLLE